MTKVIYIFCIGLLSFSASSQKISNEKSPKKASIYSAIIPGAGQVYTKKYWKVPFIYAGLITSAYYIKESYTKYNTYKKTYLNRLDGDENDEYIGIYDNNALVILTEHYRRNTEMSVLLFTLSYVINIVDASISAHLFNYDVSDDISLKIDPMLNFNQAGVSFTVNL